ncbi:hypothetical protein GBA52_012114 [Prunus armeniaca]|nr:hypothetical protein GBA52_012114 [Prunus armeniaca]
MGLLRSFGPHQDQRPKLYHDLSDKFFSLSLPHKPCGTPPPISSFQSDLILCGSTFRHPNAYQFNSN